MVAAYRQFRKMNDESKYHPAPIAHPAVIKVPTMNRLSALTSSRGNVYCPSPTEKNPANPAPRSIKL